MPLLNKVEGVGFSYAEIINELTADVITEAENRFNDFKQRGVIIAGDFHRGDWTVTDEVRKSYVIKFDVNEVAFHRSAVQKLDCSFRDYQTALRVYAITRFGYAFSTIIENVKTLVRFAENLQLPDDIAEYGALQDILELLPGESDFRDRLELDMLGAAISQRASSKAMPRTLSAYWTYFSFGHYLTKFWKSADQTEKLLFFPLWLWWTITTTIPLRVTEFVLTPRRCIRKENGAYYIKLRRTLLKRKNRSARYSIKDDYEICEYSIPQAVYSEIADYLTATAGAYDSDIDTLFCKGTQFMLGPSKIRSDNHYTRDNLRQLLDYFYDFVLNERFGLQIMDDNAEPYQNAIGKIRLGDTRHIALINLMVSGNSVTLCQELARHSDFESSSHYYSNIKSFVDCMVFHPFSQEYVKNNNICDFISDPKEFIPIADGFCTSSRFAAGDYSVCENAVSAGEVGECHICPYFYAPKSTSDIPTGAESQLKTSCSLFSSALDAIRAGLPTTDPLPAIIAKLHTAESNYLTASILTRRLAEEEVIQCPTTKTKVVALQN